MESKPTHCLRCTNPQVTIEGDVVSCQECGAYSDTNHVPTVDRPNPILRIANIPFVSGLPGYQTVASILETGRITPRYTGSPGGF